MKRVLALLLALVMVFALAACGGEKNPTPTTTPTEAPAETQTPAETEEPKVDPRLHADELVAADDYDGMSSYVYELALGDFYDNYMLAKEQDSVSMRWAYMAIAEAELLESGVMMPLTTKGGNYAISRIAPYGYGNALWGNDSDRFHNYIVADEFIKAAEIAEMKAKWAELKGTGEYEQWAKDYLTEKGYTLQNEVSIGYTSDPQTWDALATSRSADSEALVNTYDDLVEYDNEGVMQPALATSWENTVNEDGTETWTFHIREGVKWVDSQGREVADVTADDFVASMQHMADAMGGLEYLLGADGCNVVNFSAYIDGEITDFAEVGVKAVDDYTLEYTLAAPCSFFTSMLTYNCFSPMSRSYFLSKGGAFGADEFAAAKDSGNYTYGLTPNDIAYCGPYLVKNFTSENTIVFEANPTYWNAENINMQRITWLFNDGQDATKAYNDAKAGVLSGCGLNASALEACKADNLFDEYCYVSATDATSYMAFYNLYRQAYANFNDQTMCVSAQTDEDKDRTHSAMLNDNFRKAIALSLDRAAYNATTQGEDLKLNNLRNTYTPGNFVSLTEEITIDINGVSKTYPAGTMYGEIMQDQIDADGFPIKVWDPENSTSDSFDGWYNPDAAAEYLQLAIDELAEYGIEVSAENPIKLDLPAYTGSEVYANRANVYKQSLETNMKGCVEVTLLECPAALDWYNAGYYPETGYDMNANIMDVSGWGPDYGDPQTYLDTMLPDYAGYMIKSMGIF